jgi:D-alanyl-D-alanine carboxypeptidase (penicillin-binding protein 5/6)
MRQSLILSVLVLIGLALFGFFTRPEPPASQAYISESTPALRAAQAYLLPVSEPAYAPIRDTTIPGPTLDANAALVVHLETGRVLFEKNSNVQVPIASLTKLVSVVVTTELFDMQEIISIASTSIRVDGQKQTLYEGERMSVGDLVTMMLVESSNDAAYAVAAYAQSQGIDFVAHMNRVARQLGMDDCRFTNPAGLDDTAFCSAASVFKLIRHMMRSPAQIWSVTTSPEITLQSADGRFLHQLKNTNELLGIVEGIRGGKTGYTDGALGCLALIVELPQKNDTLVSIVLGSRGRFADTQTLLQWTQRAYRWK